MNYLVLSHPGVCLLILLAALALGKVREMEDNENRERKTIYLLSILVACVLYIIVTSIIIFKLR